MNPLLVEGQIVGGVVQGIGAVLREQMVYDSGGYRETRAMMDYVLPGASDVPEDFRLWHMETPTSLTIRLGSAASERADPSERTPQ